MAMPQVKAEDFFLGYRKVALQPHEVLLRVSIPFNAKNEYVREFKQAHRRDDDIAIVNAGMRVQMARAMSGRVRALLVLSPTPRNMYMFTRRALLAIEYPQLLCCLLWVSSTPCGVLSSCNVVTGLQLQYLPGRGLPVEVGRVDESAHAGEWVAEDVKIAYGGVAPKTIMAPKVQAAIKGQPWTGETLKKALEAVAVDVNITANAPGAASLICDPPPLQLCEAAQGGSARNAFGPCCLYNMVDSFCT